MAWPKFISLSRLWYTLIVVLIHLILVYVGLKQHYFYANLARSSSSPIKYELLIQKVFLIVSIIILPLFTYPALFRVGNFANDNRSLTMVDLRKRKLTSVKDFWHHSYSFSSSLHLFMSFLVLVSPMLVQSKQITMIFKDTGNFIFKTFDQLYHNVYRSIRWIIFRIFTSNRSRLTL